VAAGDRPSRPPPPCPPDHVVGKRPSELTLAVQGDVVEGDRRAVAVILQRSSRRRVFVPTSVLASDDSAVGDARGT
jgi:hypothetical protein